MTKELNEQSFKELTESSKQLVLVDFWAPWCGPCRQLAPTLDELSAELEGKVTIAKVNVDDFPDIAAKHNVRGIPSLILFKNGSVVDTKVGALSKAALIAWFDSAA
jgi:thioredoxin 1